MTSYGYITVDSCIISFNLNFIMQLKQFCYIATKVSSRKKCYYFWWSTWLLKSTSTWNIEKIDLRLQYKFHVLFHDTHKNIHVYGHVCVYVTSRLSNIRMKDFSGQVSMGMVKYEDKILILGQNYIFCGHRVVKFFSLISPTESTYF